MHRSALAFLALTATAHAVTVQGRVTTPLGVPLPNVRVQLVQGTRAVGLGVTGPDGVYQITSSLSGRFLLLASRSPLVQIGTPFYAGPFDLVTRDIALAPAEVVPEPPQSLPTRPEIAEPPQLLPDATLAPTLRTLPGAFLLERGPTGSPAELYVEGAAPTATLLRLDQASIDDLGGSFDLSTLSTAGLAALTSIPALTLTTISGLPDAEAATLDLSTPIAETLNPILTLSASAAPLDTYLTDATLTATRRRADLLAAFALFSTANEGTPYRIVTAALSAGYHISANTALRATFRDDTARTAVAPYFNVFRDGRQNAQNLYSTATLARAGHWQNALTYTLSRKRRQDLLFTPALLLPLAQPPRQDSATNRDEVLYTTRYPYRPWLAALLTLRFQNERAVFQAATSSAETLRAALIRTHLTAAPAFSGDLRHRFFYSAAATLDRSSTYGFHAAPQLGLTYAAVRPSTRRFRGSILRATASTGFREPSVLEFLASPATPRARSFHLAEDQQILPNLTFTTTYFHHQFSHDFEPSANATPLLPAQFTPTLAYRAQGLSLALRSHPWPRLRLAASYTYLASLVEQSQSAGILSAPLGQRPFYRPPHTAGATATYNGTHLTAGLSLALASRANDASYLSSVRSDPGQVSLDADAAYTFSRRLTLTAALTNLTNSRTLAPLGFTSTPFLIRTGLRLRLGHD